MFVEIEQYDSTWWNSLINRSVCKVCSPCSLDQTRDYFNRMFNQLLFNPNHLPSFKIKNVSSISFLYILYDLNSNLK